MRKNIIITVFFAFIGLVFLFGGIIKLFPIESFEFIIVTQAINNWTIAQFISRIIISFEIFLGVSLLFQFKPKKFFIQLSGILLILFCVQLLYSIFYFPSSKNCGCFGEILPMSPFSALIKNIFFIVILIYLNKVTTRESLTIKLPLSVLLLSLIIIFFLFPIKEVRLQSNQAEQRINEDSILQNEINISAIDSMVKPKEVKLIDTIKPKLIFKPAVSIFSGITDFNIGKVNLDKGIKIVALFSLDCEHCLEAAKEISQLKLPNVYVLFLGDEEQVEPFFKESNSVFPFKIIDPSLFFRLLEKSPPRISLLAEGNLYKNWDSDSFNSKELKKAVTKLKLETNLP
jgi:hypothetical protein